MRYPFVHEMFQQIADADPLAPAVVGSGRTVLYGQLEAWANNIATRLVELGETKGAIIYVATQEVAAIIASMLASLKLGGIFVPVDTHQPVARLRNLAEQVPANFVLADSNDVEKIRAATGANATIVVVNATEAGEWGAPLQPRGTETGPKPATAGPIVNSEPDDPCYIYFTSGSSGRPKAITGRLQAIDHFVRWEIEEFGVRKGTVVSQLTSPVFDAFLRDAFVTLCAGGVLHVPEGRETTLDSKRLAQWLNEASVEIVHAVPSLFRLILGEPLKPEMFPSLRYVALAGEPVLSSDVRRWMDVFGDRIQLINMYGPTETTMVKLFHRIKRNDIELASIPVGRPMPGAKIFVLNDAAQLSGEGAVGEIYIQTPYRTLGYYKNPEMTNEVFIPNPLSADPNDIVYRTGDFGRILEDGNLEFVGRKDQQVKIRGVRIELEGIENDILDTGLVTEAAVTSRTDSLGNAYLCAYIVSTGDDSSDALREALLGIFPEYQVPSIFIRLESLPRTQTLKVDRKALPDPDDVRGSARQFIEPRNQMEQEVADLFAEVLGLDKVGVDEEFFRLGGHSLLAMKLLSRLSTYFEVELPLALLFEYPTVEKMTINIEERRQLGPSTPAYFKRSPSEGDLDSAPDSRVGQMTDAEVESLLSDILSINE